MLKILLADDHDIIRNGLKIIINNYTGNTVVDDAWDGSSAFSKIEMDDYNLIILDVNMPHTDSVKLVTDILVLKPQAKILMMSMNNEDIYARKYLQIGAMGYLNKSSPESEIKKAIENVLNNKRYISAALLENLTQHNFSEKIINPFDRLSKNEREVLTNLLKGKTVGDISVEMDVDTLTIDSYKARIFKKLNCRSIQEISSLVSLHNFNCL